MKKLYIFVGKNKDPDGYWRRTLEQTVEQYATVTDTPSQADVIAVLGGDGTIMRAATEAIKYNVPVIGINLGRVGYMAELDKSEIPLIERYFKNEYTEEARMMLSVKIGKRLLYSLNDAVVHSKNKHMSHLTLTCNGSVVNEYRGDGVIFATPTGSTAYSMSAGGSAIDPRLKCICVTPICPQSLSAKALVFAPDSKLELVAQTMDCVLTVDGNDPIPLERGASLKIKRSDKKLRMIKLKEDGFYEVLRKKNTI